MSSSALPAVRTLAERYAEVVQSLSDEEWSRPSACPGWSVQDLVAHTGSNFRVLVEPPDGPPPSPAPTAEQLQDLLVVQRRGWSSAEVTDEFVRFLEPAIGVLEAMQQEPTASASLTLSDLGTYPMHALADAFAFDLWCHFTEDLLTPSGPVDRPRPEATDDLLRPGIDWMLAGLPQMCPSASEALERPLGLRLTGPGGGEWTLRPEQPLLVVEQGLGGDVAATVVSPATDFVRWGTTRSPWRSSVRIDGDEAYAARVLDAVNIV